MEVARHARIFLVDTTNATSAKLSYKVSKLEDHVGACSIFFLPLFILKRVLIYGVSHLIRRKQNERITNITVFFKLLNDCCTAIRLPVKDNRFQTNLFEESFNVRF